MLTGQQGIKLLQRAQFTGDVPKLTKAITNQKAVDILNLLVKYKCKKEMNKLHGNCSKINKNKELKQMKMDKISAMQISVTLNHQMHIQFLFGTMY